jgi:hypothetical protein
MAWTLCIVLLVATTICGCEHKAAPPTTVMKVEEIILKNRDVPIGKSIQPIAAALANQSVLVAGDGQEKKAGGKLGFKVAADNRGQLWAYAYTSESEFSKAFPQGGGFAEMKFSDLFNVIEPDARFGGICLNAGSVAQYYIPREMFGDLKLK